MFEVKASQAWQAPVSILLPSANLTATETRRLAERDQMIDKALLEIQKPEVYLKINKGIFRGSVFAVRDKNGDDYYDKPAVTLHEENYLRNQGGGSPEYYYLKGKDLNKKWVYASRYLTFQAYTGRRPLKFNEGWIFGEFLSSDVQQSLSLLVDYQGGPVFCLDTKERPLSFQDRLDQEVNIDDLVVVALNYGAGLDICRVRGFADERRVVIESIETGEFDRIGLENNQTKKIMRMPNSLKDTALMLKLAR
jgi:hypothetical protein